MKTRFSTAVAALVLLTQATSALAAEPLPARVVQAVVWIACGSRQGTGTVINGDQGYVLTNAHVAIDIATKTPAKTCIVAFLDKTDAPPIFMYQATVERYVFNQSRNQDYAILKISEQMSRAGLNRPFPFLKTNEFPAVGQHIRLLGYSDHQNDTLVQREGKITGFSGGWIETDAPIYPGDSGGAVIDDNQALVGLPTATLTVSSGTEVVTETSQMVDLRAILNWLDTEGRDAHDTYVTHLDYPRYHQTAIYLDQDSLGCDDLVRTWADPAVYCVVLGDRYVFPNADTYHSWYKDFSQVKIITERSLANLPITRNVTYRPGTLVKSMTGSDVYIVIDSYGTLRGIPSEARAAQIAGPEWASKIHFIPDAFFVNYQINQPLDP